MARPLTAFYGVVTEPEAEGLGHGDHSVAVAKKVVEHLFWTQSAPRTVPQRAIRARKSALSAEKRAEIARGGRGSG
jgi:hypothetical protein